MAWLLDTDVLSESSNPQPSERVMAWLDAHDHEVHLSTISLGEIVKGIELMDAPDQIAEGYDPAIIWDGLGLIGFHLIPHYESGAADSPAADKVAMYLLDEALPYRTMRDGDVLIQDAAGIRGYEATRP